MVMCVCVSAAAAPVPRQSSFGGTFVIAIVIGCGPRLDSPASSPLTFLTFLSLILLQLPAGHPASRVYLRATSLRAADVACERCREAEDRAHQQGDSWPHARSGAKSRMTDVGIIDPLFEVDSTVPEMVENMWACCRGVPGSEAPSRHREGLLSECKLLLSGAY